MSDSMVIYTFGGMDVMVQMFNGIAAITQGESLNALIKMAGTLGLAWAAIMSVLRNQISEGGKWLLWFIISTNLLLVPKTSVRIKDELVNKPATVDNVPYFLGKTASIFSTIGYSLTTMMEQNFSPVKAKQMTEQEFSPVEATQYHKTGTVFASKLVSRARHFKITDADFNENISNFINRCVTYDAMIGNKYTVEDLRNADDIWSLVSENASQILGMMYRYPKDEKTGKREGSKIITCKEVAKNLQSQWKAEYKRAAAIYGSQMTGNLGVNLKQNFTSKLHGTFSALTKISGDANELLRQQMMINAIDEASNNKVNELGGATNYATTKALMQQKSTYQITGELAGRLLPTMKIVFECLAYGAFIIVVVLALLPSGWRIMTTYFGILMWIQMWPPLYAILNLMMNISAYKETSGLTEGKGLTLVTSLGISEVNSGIESLAGYLSMSIPFISYAIIKGGAASFIHLAGHLGSAIQSASSATASEVTSGNVSLGNYSQGMQSYNNTSAFQHNTSPNYSSGQHRQVMDSGAIKTNQADGSTVFTGGAGYTISTGATQMSLGKHVASSLNEGLANSNSLLENSSKELSTAESSAFRQSVDFTERALNGSSSGETFNYTDSAGNRVAINDTLNLGKNLQSNYGFTAQQAATAAVQATIGGSLGAGNNKGHFNIGANGNGGFNTTASRTKGFELANMVREEMGYSSSNESALTSAKDVRFGENQSEEKALAESMAASYEKVQSSRDTMSVAKQDVQTYTSALNNVQSDSMNINQNLDQKYLEYLSEQIGSNGVDKIGPVGANEIWNGKGSELLRAKYTKAFVQQYADNLVSDIRNNTDQNYDIKSNELNNQSEVKGDFKTIKDHATSQGVEKGMVNNQPKSIVEENMQKNQDMIEINKVGLQNKSNQKNESYKKEQDKSLVRRTLEGVSDE